MNLSRFETQEQEQNRNAIQLTTHTKTGLCEFIPGEQVEEQLGSVLFSQSIGGVTEYCDNDKGKLHITA